MAKNVVGLSENPSDAQAAMHDLASAGFSGDSVSLVQNASSRLSSIWEQLSIPQDDATLYMEGLRNGGALIILQRLADDDASRAADILNRHNIVDIDTLSRRSARTGETATVGTASTAPASMAQTAQTAERGGMAGTSTGRRNFYEGGDMVIPIVEEELRIGKREVESGGVRVNVAVAETPVNEQVTLREEEVRVERRRVDRPASEADFAQAQQAGTLEVRERDEEAVVDKQARVVEEVVINKEAQERTETIQDTVRRTDVDVEEIPGQTRTGSYTETTRVNATDTARTGGTATTGSGTGSSSGGDEGIIERGLSKAENAVERATGLDLDRDKDVGQRDPRNNY